MHMEIIAVPFENAQKHINALRGKIFFLLALKLAVCTPTVRVVSDNYSSLKLPCLKSNGRQSVIKFVDIKNHKIDQRLFTYYIHTT